MGYGHGLQVGKATRADAQNAGRLLGKALEQAFWLI